MLTFQSKFGKKLMEFSFRSITTCTFQMKLLGEIQACDIGIKWTSSPPVQYYILECYQQVLKKKPSLKRVGDSTLHITFHSSLLSLECMGGFFRSFFSL